MFTLVCLIAGIICSIVLSKVAVTTLQDKRRDMNMEQVSHYCRLASRSILITTVLGCGLSAFTWTFKQIPPGSVGIASLWGKVQDRPLTEGLNIVNPLYDITIMSVQMQKHAPKSADGQNIPYVSASSDMQIVHVQMVLNYSLSADTAPKVFRESGVDYESKILEPAAHEVLKAIMAQHQASEILQKRSLVKADIQKTLATWLAKYGIELKEVSLQNISFDKNYETAIENKQIQEQEAEAKTYKLQQAVKDAEIQAAQAKGRGDSLRAEAQGAADALKLKGAAEAEYNQKVAESLSPVLIQQKWLEKWDGKLPVYSMGSNGGNGMILQMPEMPTKK